MSVPRQVSAKRYRADSQMLCLAISFRGNLSRDSPPLKVDFLKENMDNVPKYSLMKFMDIWWISPLRNMDIWWIIPLRNPNICQITHYRPASSGHPSHMRLFSTAHSSPFRVYCCQVLPAPFSIAHSFQSLINLDPGCCPPLPATGYRHRR